MSMDDEQKQVILEAIKDTADDLWTEFDTDGSGYLEREEFKNFCIKMSDALNIKKLADDSSSNQFPNLNEIVDEMIIKLEGENGDKKISKDEMINYLKALYGIAE